MAISFTRPDPASPASVSAAQFPTSRRGYDQAEVRDFLRMVAAEQARLQERERFLDRELKAALQAKSIGMESIDEDTAIRLLGEEAARVLQTAREAAVQIRARAEEASARLLRDATDEAQRLREEAEIEAARRRQDAAADSEAELSMAKQQGRDMVNEARAYRERVLSELARRRELARQQIEQLVHGRDRLLQAFERSRVAAVEVMNDLAPLGEPNEYVNLQPTTGPVPIMVPSRARARAADLAALVRDAVPTSTDASEFDDQRTAPVSLVPESPVAVVPDMASTAIDAARPFDPNMTGSEPVVDARPDLRVVADFVESDDPDEQIADMLVADMLVADMVVADMVVADMLVADATDQVVADVESVQAEDAHQADEAVQVDDAFQVADALRVDDTVQVADARLVDESGPVSEPVQDDGEPEADPITDGHREPEAETIAEVISLFAGEVDPPSPRPVGATVEDLFARLRASRTDAIGRMPDSSAEAHVGLDASDVADAIEIDRAPRATATADHALADVEEADPADRVDEIIVPLIISAARKLKRVLADEQNDLLDTLRRKDPIRSLDVLLPWEADQSARYVSAVEEDLLSAASAGALGGENGRNPAIIRPAVDAVTNEIVAPLRDRLIRCIDRAEGDNVDLGNQVRVLYREWKTQRIDDHVEDIVRLAYDRGALTIASR